MRIAVAGGTGRIGRHVVEVLKKRGHEVVPMSRATGVNVFTGNGLAEALAGVACIIETQPADLPEGKDEAAAQDNEAAAAFFTTAARNMQQAGEQAGVRLAVVVSIIGIDKLTTVIRAKLAHEQAWLAGPIPVRILRSAPFHELVLQMMEWSREGDLVHLPRDACSRLTLATSRRSLPFRHHWRQRLAPGSILEVAGPRTENLVDLGALLAVKRGRLRQGDWRQRPQQPGYRDIRVGCCPGRPERHHRRPDIADAERP